MIKAIIFDYDGVIVDSIKTTFEINQKVMERLGAKKFNDLEDFKERFGNYEDYYRNIDPGNPNMLKKAVEIFFEEFKKLQHDQEIYAGIDVVLKKLSKKYKLGIVSHNFREFIEKNLKKFGLLDCISSIVDNSISNIKPHPDHVIICLKELGVKPENVCMIGDSPVDITVARNAKLAKMIAVTYGDHPKERLPNADYYAENPKDILRILETIE